MRAIERVPLILVTTLDETYQSQQHVSMKIVKKTNLLSACSVRHLELTKCPLTAMDLQIQYFCTLNHTQPLTEMSTRSRKVMLLEVKRGRCVGLTT
jgi:hypothetical protein